MDYLISSLIGYLFGSIPTAYIVLKKARGIDITKSGSGNVGAMNSYEVSSSKFLGFIVLLVDALKGIIPVIISLQAFDWNFSLAGLSLIFSIFSHCFNPWLRFKGGRGLATAAGGSLILAPLLLITWIIIWLAFYFIKKDILTSNIMATIISLISVLVGNNIYLQYSNVAKSNLSEIVLILSSGLILIFIKHTEPINEIIEKNKKNKNDK